MKTHRIESNNCPTCNNKLDAASNAYDDSNDSYYHSAPDNGDITICLYCSAILEFCANGLKVADLTQLPTNEAWKIMQLSEQIRNRFRSRSV